MPTAQPDPDLLVAQIPASRPLPPVESWNPPLSGVMDLHIRRDGTWHHAGRPIQREALVRLFASILRRDADDQYYLVTPVEKWRIQVEDAPFRAVRLDASGQGHAQRLTFTTNVGDVVIAGPDHPLTVEYQSADGEPAPYLHVRGGLRALLTRAVFLELVELGEARQYPASATGTDTDTNTAPSRDEPADEYGVWSQGQFFILGHLNHES